MAPAAAKKLAHSAAVTSSSKEPIGVATFALDSGKTMVDSLADVAASLAAADDSSGNFAFFKVIGTGDYHLFISDGVSGVSVNDVIVSLVGVKAFNVSDLAEGNLTIVSWTGKAALKPTALRWGLSLFEM